MNLENDSAILKHGKLVIYKEREALSLLQDNLDQAFVDIVKLILNNKGRTVISGIGKSALVANKIVATMNSTGTAAIFMHAADAAHGDLGMIQEHDILLLISKSGETEELTFIQQMVKQFGNTVIAMTSNKTSTLGSQADYILYTPINEEADPNNLAPTSSSTVQMAMGDALAICLSAMIGFTDKHFARYHPGGTLGRQLHLKVTDVLNQESIPKVYNTDNLRQVIVEMTSKRLGATVVINKEEKILGIITDGDLRRMLNTHDKTNHITADLIMSINPQTIPSDTMAVDALKIMREYSISQLVVEQDSKYIGLVHIHDILAKGL